jgi:hypothetical protein
LILNQKSSCVAERYTEKKYTDTIHDFQITIQKFHPENKHVRPKIRHAARRREQERKSTEVPKCQS